MTTNSPSMVEIRARGVDEDAADWLRRYAASRGLTTGEVITRMVDLVRSMRDDDGLVTLLVRRGLEEPDL